MQKNSSISLSHRPLFWEAEPHLPASWDTAPRQAGVCGLSTLAAPCPRLLCAPVSSCLLLPLWGTRWGAELMLHWPHTVPFQSSIFTQGGAHGQPAPAYQEALG